MNQKIYIKLYLILNIITMSVFTFLGDSLKDDLQEYSPHRLILNQYFSDIYQIVTILIIFFLILLTIKKFGAFPKQKIFFLSLFFCLIFIAYFIFLPHFVTLSLFLIEILQELLEPWRQAFIFPRYRSMI
jgi:hypothetical protein